MKCPKCVELGLKSRLTGGDSCSTTCMGFQSYYDEEGVRHSHDPNTSSYLYKCSNGHMIHVATTNKCSSCDYGHPSSKVYFLPKGEAAVELDPELTK